MPNRKILTLFLVILLGTNSAVHAQDVEFARSMMDSLCKPFYAGRGYVNFGATKAAHFISDQYRQYRLKKFITNTLVADQRATLADEYWQQFRTMKPNIFPGKLSVVVDKKELKAGADFIVDPASAGAPRRPYPLFFGDSLFMQDMVDSKSDRIAGKAFVFDPKVVSPKDKEQVMANIFKSNPAVVIERLSGRLIWSVAQYVMPVPYLQIKKEALPDNAKTMVLQIDQRQEEVTAENVCGYIQGKKYPDSFIFVTAHYDHLGKMGSALFPGANDNASGVAMMLDMAHHYSMSANPPDYSIAFVAFTGEEAGLIGSKYFTDTPLVPLKNIAFLINMDLMGNGQDGMMVVNGEVFPKEFKQFSHLNDSCYYLKEIKKRGKAANSDHYWFTEKGVKSFFVYLLGDYPYYHDIYDTPDKPTLAGYYGAFHLITDYIDTYGKLR